MTGRHSLYLQIMPTPRSPLAHAEIALKRALQADPPVETVTLTREHATALLFAMNRRHIKRETRQERIARDARALAKAMIVAAITPPPSTPTPDAPPTSIPQA